jgi:hypothetical protein
MLLNEFLKEHRRVEKLEATVRQQQKSFQSKLAEQEKKIEALTSGLQRASAQLAAASPSDGGLEMSKFAPKTVLNQETLRSKTSLPRRFLPRRSAAKAGVAVFPAHI